MNEPLLTADEAPSGHRQSLVDVSGTDSPSDRRSRPPRRKAAPAPDRVREVPRLLLTREESARALGMSLDSFERYVQNEVRLIRRGRMRLVPLRELERWLAENVQRPMADEFARR
jgi:hypothetical protein